MQELVFNQIFTVLKSTYDGKNSWSKIEKNKNYYPLLMDSFEKWLVLGSYEGYTAI